MRGALVTLSFCASFVACAFALDYDALQGGASDAADDRPGDERTDEAAVGNDGSTSDSDGPTADSGAGFCALAGTKRCDDFSGADVASFWEKSLVGGAAALVDAPRVSEPRALRVSVSQGATAGAYLRHTVDTAGRLRVGASLRLEKATNCNTVTLLALETATAPVGYEFVQVILTVNDAGEIRFFTQFRPEDGGAAQSDGYDIATSIFDFHRYEIEIDPVAHQARVWLDGNAQPAVAWPFDARPTIAAVGVSYHSPAPTSDLVVFYDDAIIDW